MSQAILLNASETYISFNLPTTVRDGHFYVNIIREEAKAYRGEGLLLKSYN